MQKIVHLQTIANQLPDPFADTKRVTKSYIPVVNGISSGFFMYIEHGHYKLKKK